MITNLSIQIGRTGARDEGIPDTVDGLRGLAKSVRSGTFHCDGRAPKRSLDWSSYNETRLGGSSTAPPPASPRAEGDLPPSQGRREGAPAPEKKTRLSSFFVVPQVEHLREEHFLPCRRATWFYDRVLLWMCFFRGRLSISEVGRGSDPLRRDGPENKRTRSNANSLSFKLRPGGQRS